MSQLYIRVMTGFYTHRKTARLRALLGPTSDSDAFWIPPRLWAYAAENQPDGDLSGYTSEELAALIGCSKHATSILQALKDSGFVDSTGVIHDWDQHNGYHKKYADRAKTAATARWAKEKKESKKKDCTEKEKGESGDKHCLEHACSIQSVNVFEEIRLLLKNAYKRPDGHVWSYDEESSLSAISRRPNAKAECEELLKFKLDPDSFFPQSLQSLLSRWGETLDRARNTTAKPLSVTEKGILSKEYDRVLDKLKSLTSQYSGHQDWTVADKLERTKLKERRDELKAKLGIKV